MIREAVCFDSDIAEPDVALGFSHLGHLEALPPPRLNAGYQFSNPTFDGAAATDGNAPQAAVL